MTEAFPAQAATGASGPRASFGTRLLATLIDGVILFVVNSLLGLVLGRSLQNALAPLIGLAYYVYFHGSPSGQTVGKKVMNIRVIDFANGGALGYGKAALRWVGQIVSAIPCLLGFFWMIWDKEKQTWHDKIATSVVVPTSDYPVAAWPG